MASVLVKVPRASFGKYSRVPFAELLAAAERGEDGLSVTDNTTERDYAYFHDGEGRFLKGKSCLLIQGW